MRSVFALSYWVENNGSVHFNYLPRIEKIKDQGHPKKGQLSQPSVMSHAVYARGQGVVFLPEVEIRALLQFARA